jgi:hypothetical protein
MAVKDLFEGRSPAEVEALFDSWAGRDFEDIPTDTFFATLEEIKAQRPRGASRWKMKSINQRE